MAASVAVKDFKSEAEMRAHYAALHRKCFEPVIAPPVAAEPTDEPKAVEPDADVDAVRELQGDAWSEYVERLNEMFGTVEVLSFQQRKGIASVSGHDILRIVSEVTGYRQADLKGVQRNASVVRARQIAAWLLVNQAGKSSPEAGRLLGNRDHTTILHACRRVNEVLGTLAPPLPKGPEGIARLLSAVAWPREKARFSKKPEPKRHACALCGTTLAEAE